MNIQLAVKIGQLTGLTCYRTNWRGKLILQVQFYTQATSTTGAPPRSEPECSRAWRDAKLEDIETPLKPSVAYNRN